MKLPDFRNYLSVCLAHFCKAVKRGKKNHLRPRQEVTVQTVAAFSSLLCFKIAHHFIEFDEKKIMHFGSLLEGRVNEDVSRYLSSQGFSHLQSEYQKTVGGSQSPGAPNPVGQNPDWDSEYCNRECGGNHCRCVFVCLFV